MQSPKILNYEMRPCKFVERRMLLFSLSYIMASLKLTYQYVGFGGLSFTDFKLFHKELNINTMFSIEGGFPPKKVEFNKPFSFIKVLNGKSTEKLLEIDLSKPSIVWLDYDDVLTMDVFGDINILFNSLPHGSVYIMTCNRQLTKRDGVNNTSRPFTREELEEEFPGLVPCDLGTDCCADINAPMTIRKMIHDYCDTVLKERGKTDSFELKFVPLYNIKYQENRGARMYTFGGVLLNKSYDETQLLANRSLFKDADILYEIAIPNLTRKETLYIDQILDITEKEKELVEEGIITMAELERYKYFYKYMPNFYDIRL